MLSNILSFLVLTTSLDKLLIEWAGLVRFHPRPWDLPSHSHLTTCTVPHRTLAWGSCNTQGRVQEAEGQAVWVLQGFQLPPMTLCCLWLAAAQRFQMYPRVTSNTGAKQCLEKGKISITRLQVLFYKEPSYSRDSDDSYRAIIETPGTVTTTLHHARDHHQKIRDYNSTIVLCDLQEQSELSVHLWFETGYHSILWIYFPEMHCVVQTVLKLEAKFQSPKCWTYRVTWPTNTLLSPLLEMRRWGHRDFSSIRVSQSWRY